MRRAGGGGEGEGGGEAGRGEEREGVNTIQVPRAVPDDMCEGEGTTKAALRRIQSQDS